GPLPPKPQSNEGVHLWLIVLGTVLLLNMMASALLFLRPAPEAAAAAPTGMQQWDKDELLGRMKGLEKEIGTLKQELAKDKAIIAKMQSVNESLQIAVTRIPPPNEPPHGGPPPQQPAPAEQR